MREEDSGSLRREGSRKGKRKGGGINAPVKMKHTSEKEKTTVLNF